MCDGDRREPESELVRRMYSLESYDEVNRGSIGGGDAVGYSMKEFIRRLQSVARVEPGVPTVDVGGDCISDGTGSSSGVKLMGMLVGAMSMPILDGVLVIEWPLLCDRHATRDRVSNGPGDSVDAIDRLSNSGVPGSR